MPARRNDPALKPGKAPGGILWVDQAAEQAAKVGGDALVWSTVPPELDKAGRAKWIELAARYQDQELRFRENDRDALQSYCETWSLRQAVLHELLAGGIMVKGRSSADAHREVKSPLLGVFRDLSSLLHRLSSALGMNPDAAVKMGLASHKYAQEVGEYDPFRAK